MIFAAFGLASSACQTKTPEEYFQLGADVERFKLGTQTTRRTEVRIYPKIDILWVIDNSGSMGDDQNRLTAAFGEFSQSYLANGKLDIRTAVITTDTYLGGTGTRPTNYSFLSSGCHDGIRPPCTGADPRSGKPILSTRYSDGSVPSASDVGFFQDLVSAFSLNAKPGTRGDGNESATASIISFLRNNENPARWQPGVNNADYQFFRKGSIRLFIPFSDAVDSCAPTSGGQGPCFSMATRAQSFKDEVDRFFMELDGTKNYYMTAVRSTQDGGNHSAQITYDSLVDLLAVDTSNPQAKLSKVVGLLEPMDTVLDGIGAVLQTIFSSEVTIIAEFTLTQEVDTKVPVVVSIVRAVSGEVAVISPDQYQITGKLLQIRPEALAGFSPDDEVRVQYIRDPFASSGS